MAPALGGYLGALGVCPAGAVPARPRACVPPGSGPCDRGGGASAPLGWLAPVCGACSVPYLAMACQVGLAGCMGQPSMRAWLAACTVLAPTSPSFRFCKGGPQAPGVRAPCLGGVARAGAPLFTVGLCADGLSGALGGSEAPYLGLVAWVGLPLGLFGSPWPCCAWWPAL